MDFKALPKIELHAHLTGSVSRQTLHDIWATKHAAGTTTLDDPSIVMPAGKHDYNLETFFPLFSSYIYGLLPDAASLTRATRSVLDDFAADGVLYLELRTTPRRTTEMTKEVYVRTVVAAIQAWEADQTASPAPGSSAPRMRMCTRLILSIDRRDALPEAHEVLRIADLLRRESDMIVGVDLCGDPAKRTPSDPRGSVAVFTDVFRAAKTQGFGVTVHFAEAEVSGTEEELGVLLGWQPDRLGHVICLSPAVKEAVKRRGREGGIGLELCLSCNVQAKMVEGGFGAHHFGEWWGTEGCHVSLGTDDVGVFGSPLSNEYRLAAEHFNLSNAQVCELALQPIPSIFGGEAIQAQLREAMWKPEHHR
ncbi:adenosine deaminase [Verticillium alfalfae VaMs.102]|uniref:Adenosine deaminase n=1 Tax=Verticillium alfalfae (strain VaMs.102 / ATCC MYA-4576 / FGSC 10136) TaxID=526221 RepID=C9SS86_VERA1|nr:adenosine deaminase [Verticillium alfalfae VaMs.102]EEY21651.1 adenosine deaminase [Verticillium alfalfae VaMs.102]